MQADIAIIIAAYNRPASLQRLLGSIERANYAGYTGITLVISIDHSGKNDCKVIADAFEWKHGNKTVIHQPHNLGLKKHILSCGDYTLQHDAVIVLEDDLFVSAQFYDYAQQAYIFYKNDEEVAGIAFYHNVFNEVAYCPFEPIHDGYDNYFMQVPCSWGQLWTKKQWAGFINYANGITNEQVFASLPATVQEWSAASWKKLFYSYLIQTGKYFVYPRIGLSTNFGDAGQHLTDNQTVFQTPLLLSEKTFQFSTPADSLSRYDGFFELEGTIYNKLVDDTIAVTFDLNGTKPLTAITTRYLISSKKCRKPEQQFEVSVYPYENNILLRILAVKESNSCFSLGETASFSGAQQFNRLTIDFKRVFLSDVFLRNAVRAEFEQSKEFQIGSSFLKPLRFIKNLFKKSN